MIKTLTKEDLEQSKVPPAKKGDVLIRKHSLNGERWVLPYDLVWKRRPRWPAHQGYWTFDIPDQDYRYGLLSEGDQIETAESRIKTVAEVVDDLNAQEDRPARNIVDALRAQTIGVDQEKK